jgi:diguanylate cyclase with GGDEF domain
MVGVVTRRVAAVFALSCAYQSALFAVDRPVAVAVKDIVMVLVSVAGTFVIGTRARRERGSGRRTWLLGTATSAAFATGNTLSPSRAPNRSLGDLCMLIAATLIPATLMSVPTAPRGFDARCRMLLDGLISTAVLFFLGWATVMRAIYQSAHAPVQLVLALVVPSIEIVSLAMIVLQLIGRRRPPALILMALGFGAFAVTSTAYMYLAVRHLPIGRIGLEGGFVGATLLLIAAARQPISSVEERRWEPATGPRGSVPYVGVGVVVGVAAVLQARDRTLDPALLWVVLLVAGLVLLRQFMSLRVNDRLVHELHEQRLQLSHQASHDQLTGLANRYLLDTRLREALSRVTQGGYAAVLLIDLDAFKTHQRHLRPRGR